MNAFFRKIVLYIFWYFIGLIYRKRNRLRAIEKIIRGRNYKDHDYHTDICYINNGIWNYRNIDFDSLSHPYFSAGSAQKLAKSITSSQGKNILLRSYDFNSAIIRAHWSSRDIFSLNAEIDLEYSMGILDWAEIEFPKAHAYVIKDSVIIIQRNSTNYYHFMIEVLPSLIAWRDRIGTNQTLVLFKTDFVVDAIRLSGFINPINLIPANSLLFARNTKVLQLIPTGHLNVDLVNRLRLAIIQNAPKLNSFSKPKSTHVFLGRLDSEGRVLKNQKSAIAMIRRYYPEIKIIFPGELPFIEQVLIMSEARLVISIHGAQATNILWATNLMAYLEISSFIDNFDFINLAKSLGCLSFRIESQPLDPNNLWSNHECDLKELEIAIQEIANLRLF